jgi:hypothetical protein
MQSGLCATRGWLERNDQLSNDEKHTYAYL